MIKKKTPTDAQKCDATDDHNINGLTTHTTLLNRQRFSDNAFAILLELKMLRLDGAS